MVLGLLPGSVASCCPVNVLVFPPAPSLISRSVGLRWVVTFIPLQRTRRPWGQPPRRRVLRGTREPPAAVEGPWTEPRVPPPSHPPGLSPLSRVPIKLGQTTFSYLIKLGETDGSNILRNLNQRRECKTL